MPEELLRPYALLLSALVGGVVGSFLNVVAYRVPAGRSVVSPPSACPRCGASVRPRHNIPVVGWLMLRGRCADCRAPIALRYPLVEAGCALLWVLVTNRVLPEDIFRASRLDVIACALVGGYVSALLAVSLIDLDWFILPDGIVLPLIPLGLLGAALLAGRSALPDLPEAALGAALGGFVLWAIAALGRLAFSREAMGMGDVKLLAAIGAWQGAWPTLLTVILTASMLGSVVGLTLIAVRGRDAVPKIPFGPALCAGAVLSFLFADDTLMRLLSPR